MKEIYVVVLYKGAKLDLVAVAKDEKEAKIIAKTYSKLGRVIVWKAEEWHPHIPEASDVNEH